MNVYRNRLLIALSLPLAGCQQSSGNESAPANTVQFSQTKPIRSPATSELSLYKKNRAIIRLSLLSCEMAREVARYVPRTENRYDTYVKMKETGLACKNASDELEIADFNDVTDARLSNKLRETRAECAVGMHSLQEGLERYTSALDANDDRPSNGEYVIKSLEKFDQSREKCWQMLNNNPSYDIK